MSRHLDVINLLLTQKTIDVSVRTDTGTTPLHYIVRQNIEKGETEHFDIIQKMLSRGANINCQNNHGETPLLQACLQGIKLQQINHHKTYI
jgi:ankyrin repeat protein